MTARNTMLWAATLAGAVLLIGATVGRADPHGPYWHRGWGHPGPRAHGWGHRPWVGYPPYCGPYSGLGFSVEYGPDRYISRSVRQWVAGYYTSRTEQVLVEPGHFEDRVVDQVTETRYPSNGPPYTVVIQEGRRERVWVADRFETRVIQEWVPGHWVETAPTVYYESSPRVTIGGLFRF